MERALVTEGKKKDKKEPFFNFFSYIYALLK